MDSGIKVKITNNLHLILVNLLCLLLLILIKIPAVGIALGIVVGFSLALIMSSFIGDYSNKPTDKS